MTQIVGRKRKGGRKSRTIFIRTRQACHVTCPSGSFDGARDVKSSHHLQPTSPQTPKTMADIDIEAMNRIRVGLGLKPIAAPTASGLEFASGSSPDDDAPGSTLELREAAADDNWRKLHAEEQ